MHFLGNRNSSPGPGNKFISLERKEYLLNSPEIRTNTEVFDSNSLTARKLRFETSIAQKSRFAMNFAQSLQFGNNPALKSSYPQISPQKNGF